MAQTRVLKFPRNDDESAAVLVQVTSAGPKSLDLRLVATEGEAPCVCVLNHDRVASLRAKACPASEKEWEKILDSLLRQEPVEGIQTTAAVQSQSSISLTIRKQVQGVTQRLGAITLPCHQDEQIELFRWCEMSLDALAKSKMETTSSAAKVHGLEAVVSDLQAQLDELVRAKKDDETVLLHKFRDLLNEKKAKIRQQQKIIAASSSGRDHSASPEPPQVTEASISRRPAQSRPTKRKATSTQMGDEDEDAGGQAMEEEGIVKSEPEDTNRDDTSDGTASTVDDDDNDQVETRSAQSSGRSKQGEAPRKAAQTPPPQRNLPFVNAGTAASVPAGAETESDDEL